MRFSVQLSRLSTLIGVDVKNRFLLFLIIALSSIIVSGCGGKSGVVNDEPTLIQSDDLDVAQLVGKRPATLAELVESVASSQYSSLESIYNRPPEGMDDYFIRLDEENETLFLAENVSAFTRDGSSLAVGLESGTVRLFGSQGCAAVQTQQAPVKNISWFDGSSILAATSGDSNGVEVFDLSKCARVNVADVNGTVSTFSLSPKGTWLAVVDSVRRLWVGPAVGKLKQIARFRFFPLVVHFSDKEGILIVVDNVGWVTMWSPLKGKEIQRFQIEGGPFKKGSANGAILNLVPLKGHPFSINMVTQGRESFRVKDNSFYLKNGVLTYSSPRKRLSRRVFFRKPTYSVERSPSKEVFRVNDVDGSVRYYFVKNGNPVGHKVTASDWKDVKIGRDTIFSYRGKNFCLAEVIAQREFQRLYCRYIVGKGYYLWWAKVARPDDFFKSRGQLPVRKGISVDSPVDWKSLNPGELDVRDMK